MKGIHLYINIKNLDDIVENTEDNKMSRVIHYLDTYFSSIEAYAKGLNEKVVIEKITGSRLHIYITGDAEMGLKISWEIAKYSASLCKYLDEEIYEYSGLEKFKIQVGACYGRFYSFVYKDESTEEETSIGYAANFAAKLQALASVGEMAISESIYELIKNNEIKSQFKEKTSDKIKKYEQDKYYVVALRESAKHFNESMFEYAKNKSSKSDINDIEFSGANNLIDVKYLSLTKAKKVEGIPLFADVRGFTTLFNEDDSNLEEMKIRTTALLKTMKTEVEKGKGVHIQFQGDREVALFHNYGDISCVKQAVFTAMRLIDKISDQGLFIGIGEDFGKVYLAKIGARGEKDNLMIGKVVLCADELEDDKANKNEIAISKELYAKLNIEDRNLASIFTRRNDYYCTNVPYKKYSTDIRYSQLKENTANKNYNGAWRNE